MYIYIYIVNIVLVLVCAKSIFNSQVTLAKYFLLFISAAFN